jgi:hypothetical protein
MSESSIITLRLPQALLDRADQLIDRLSRDEEAVLLGRVSRSIVLRLALLRGLEQLEGQHGVAPAASPAPKKAAKAKRAR